MLNIKEKLDNLITEIFAVEESLPSFMFTQQNKCLTDEQYLRQNLYKIRCELTELKRYYPNVHDN